MPSFAPTKARPPLKKPETTYAMKLHEDTPISNQATNYAHECNRETLVVPAETAQRMERRVRRLIAVLEAERAENLKLKQGAKQFDLEMFVTRQAYRLQEALEKAWAD